MGGAALVVGFSSLTEVAGSSGVASEVWVSRVVVAEDSTVSMVEVTAGVIVVEVRGGSLSGGGITLVVVGAAPVGVVVRLMVVVPTVPGVAVSTTAGTSEMPDTGVIEGPVLIWSPFPPQAVASIHTAAPTISSRRVEILPEQRYRDRVRILGVTIPLLADSGQSMTGKHQVRRLAIPMGEGRTRFPSCDLYLPPTSPAARMR